MLLYVMRHGPSEDNAPSGLDADRRLTPDGRALVTVAAKELASKIGQRVPRIFTSPLARAIETAGLVRSELVVETTVTVREDLVPDDDPPLALLRELVAAGADAMIVGHQPGLEILVRSLAEGAGRGSIPFGFRTAMVMSLEAGSPRSGADLAGLGRWQVRMLLDPRAAGRP